jgi:hypothetical protein
MFKRRYLSIFVLAVLLVVVGSMIFVRSDLYGSYAVCRDYLFSRSIPDGPLKYQYTDFSSDDPTYPPITVVFDDGLNTITCHVRRIGSKWYVLGIGGTLISPLP